MVLGGGVYQMHKNDFSSGFAILAQNDLISTNKTVILMAGNWFDTISSVWIIGHGHEITIAGSHGGEVNNNGTSYVHSKILLQGDATGVSLLNMVNCQLTAGNSYTSLGLSNPPFVQILNGGMLVMNGCVIGDIIGSTTNAGSPDFTMITAAGGTNTATVMLDLLIHKYGKAYTNPWITFTDANVGGRVQAVVRTNAGGAMSGALVSLSADAPVLVTNCVSNGMSIPASGTLFKAQNNI
jgi:hypothetical protein